MTNSKNSAAILPNSVRFSDTFEIPATLHMAGTGNSGTITMNLDGDLFRVVLSRRQLELDLCSEIWDSFEAACNGADPVTVDSGLLGAFTSEAQPVKERKARKEKQAREHAPKPWDGIELKGRGYTIRFDAEKQLTRLIFKRYPGRAAVELAKQHGFSYNAQESEWRRGYKKSSYDAAMALHHALH